MTASRKKKMSLACCSYLSRSLPPSVLDFISKTLQDDASFFCVSNKKPDLVLLRSFRLACTKRTNTLRNIDSITFFFVLAHTEKSAKQHSRIR
ncbi:MAG: hypothetical protein BYD32DRAFT_268059 [Podila humilis]|nr:MAG: hypothetical protein BYD32DRAFT_268059 [Podila humilis]